MARPAYEPRFDPGTGLWSVRDDRGPILGFEDIETLGDAEAHALDLIEADRIAAIEEAAAQADYEAHDAPVLARAA